MHLHLQRIWYHHGIPKSITFILTIVLVSIPPSLETRNRKKHVEEADPTENIAHLTLSPENYSTSSVVKIGSFNLKQFGAKKSKNEEVLKIIAKIVIRYELIALQEITDVKETSIKKLMGAINQESSFPYHYVISPRVGRTNQKEQYALIFRPDIFKVKRSIVFDDLATGDPFSREPQITEILLKRNDEKIVIINVHVAPKNASYEINALTDVHTWVENKWRLGNIVILGDLNADCDYIRKKDIPSIRLLNNAKKYKWLISNNIDTTVGNTNCAYDRIIISGPFLTRNVIENSAGVFAFDREFGLDQKAALNVSDHYPVEFSVHIDGPGDNYQASDEPPHRIEFSGEQSIVSKFEFYMCAVTMCIVLSKSITSSSSW